MKNRWLLAGLLVLAAPAVALEPPMDAGQLAHALDRLTTTARVLYVAAHPDDENTRLLTYLANHRHLTAAYLSMTRGGGGQNLIGGEQGALLDVIRTEELLAARGLDGAVQRFTRMRDFGYSKRAQETLEWWGREEALSDVVRVIRAFQPDVIITRFDEQPPNHGHHTASALLAREAFAAAADPARFPEHGLLPWQAKRLMQNFATWREQKVPEGALSLDVGGYDPRTGLGYGELAARSRSQHRSQGFGVPGERGQLVERFVHVAGAPATRELLEGVEEGWARYGEAGKAVAAKLEAARRLLDRDAPERAVGSLLEAHELLQKLPDEVRVRDGREALARVVGGALGLFIRATAPRPTATPGAKLELQVELVVRRPGEVVLEQVHFPGARVPGAGPALAVNEKRLIPQSVTLAADAPISTPYWLSQPGQRGRYEVTDAALIGAPRGPPALTVKVDLKLSGRPMTFEVPVVHAWTDRVHGERVRPFLIVPPATVTPLRDAVLSVNGKPAPVVHRVKAGADGVEGQVRIDTPPGWKANPDRAPVTLAKAGDEAVVRFELTPSKDAKAGELRPSFVSGDHAWAFREDLIDYPHLPVQLVLQPPDLRVAQVSATIPKDLVGYVMGSGDSIPDDLAHVGVKVELLDDATLRAGALERYGAIVLGVRAYNTRPAVRAAHSRLMAYVERGGRLVVQYNTHSRWSPLEGPIGPFPLELGNDRITDETAAMTAVAPAHPLLKTPHAIGPADFEGWVQERGIYFAKTWDPRYTPLLQAADPQEQPLEGGTLVARHGKGRYVYTGLAFFRQLRAGVPGAYRLLLNLIGGK